MIKADNRCETCGGRVDEEGRTLAPVPRVSSPRPKPAAPAPPLDDDDPLPHLSPVERFNEAIERRDQLVRSRRG
jgi:hypothetical protein